MARARNADEGRPAKAKDVGGLDLELEDLPPAARWREWMGRIEAVIFASGSPVSREMLARVVGKDYALESILDDIREELRARPYELVRVVGGWSFRSKLGFGDAIQTAFGTTTKPALSKANAVILMAIGYFRPITRGELSRFFGREISRDVIAILRSQGLIVAGPRSPTPGAPYAYVTTAGFLREFGLESLRDLPDIEKLEDAGLLGGGVASRRDDDALARELRDVLGLAVDDGEQSEDAA